MKKLALLIGTIFILNGLLIGQSKKSFRDKLAKEVEQCRAEKSYDGNFDAYSKKFPAYVLDQTKGFLNDSSSDVRFLAINIVAKLVQLNNDKMIRQQGVYELLCTHQSSLHTATKRFRKFEKGDFNSASKDSIRSYIKTEAKRVDGIILLAGFLDMYDQLPVLKALLDYPENLGAKQRWTIRLALARMGDVDETNYCIEFAKKQGCSLHAVYRVFPDLIYTRQKAIFDYLIGIMQNDAIKTPSANPMSDKTISCGYRIMELFPGIVENYPLKHALGNQIASNDYKAALETARKWFKENPDYKIDRERF